MLVRIDVIERKPAGAKGLELCFDLGSDLPAYRRPRENVPAEPRYVLAEAPGRIDKIGQLLWRQHRQPLDQHDMQTYVQSRQASCPHDCVPRGQTGDHEARRRQDATLMSGFNGFVDLGRQPEIVSRDNDTFQYTGSRRSRRNRKNSSPSRRRRFIMSGLRTISPTMEAIFGARK